MVTARAWFYVLRFELGAEGVELSILARCTSAEKARAFRVQRRLPAASVLVRPAPVKLAPGRYTGRSLDEAAGLSTGRLVRCFAAVDD